MKRYIGRRGKAVIACFIAALVAAALAIYFVDSDRRTIRELERQNVSIEIKTVEPEWMRKWFGDFGVFERAASVQLSHLQFEKSQLTLAGRLKFLDDLYLDKCAVTEDDLLNLRKIG